MMPIDQEWLAGMYKRIFDRKLRGSHDWFPCISIIKIRIHFRRAVYPGAALKTLSGSWRHFFKETQVQNFEAWAASYPSKRTGQVTLPHPVAYHKAYSALDKASIYRSSGYYFLQLLLTYCRKLKSNYFRVAVNWRHMVLPDSFFKIYPRIEITTTSTWSWHSFSKNHYILNKTL